MKKIISFACLLLLTAPLLFAQGAPKPAAQNEPENAIVPDFDLDFPGGTPAELVKAIEKASGKPLNVIINKEDKDTHIPALKMNSVNVAQLFGVLAQASEHYIMDPNTGAPYRVSYGFKTSDPRFGANSIWYFYANNPPDRRVPKSCFFYSLAPYLERGLTVDDITTAIQTGWKMETEHSPFHAATMPELNYHKETKILICYGTMDDAKTINSVLQALPRTTANTSELEQLHQEVNHLTQNYKNMTDQMVKMGLEIKELRQSAEKSGK